MKLTKFQVSALEVIESAARNKTFHLIVHPQGAGVTHLLNNCQFPGSLYNPQILPQLYKYGLLIFDFGDKFLKMDAEYYASKYEDIKSGIVIFSNQDIELNIKGLKRHFLA